MATPPFATSATEGLDDVQTADPVRSSVVPSLKVPLADKFCISPAGTAMDCGETAMDCKVGTGTVFVVCRAEPQPISPERRAVTVQSTAEKI